MSSCAGPIHRLFGLSKKTNEWRQVHGHYHRSSSGGGSWDMKKPIPERWTIGYENLKFHIKPTSFKHTGLFLNKLPTGAG